MLKAHRLKVNPRYFLLQEKLLFMDSSPSASVKRSVDFDITRFVMRKLYQLLIF